MSRESMMRKHGLTEADFKPKPKTEEPKITDELGNVYTQYIGNDGTVKLKMIESYNGELFE